MKHDRKILIPIYIIKVYKSKTGSFYERKKTISLMLSVKYKYLYHQLQLKLH